MFRRSLFASLFVIAVLTLTPRVHSARAGAMTQSRAAYLQTIRSAPLLERPDRFGHFYGNTVRRLHRTAAGSGVR